MTKEQIIRKYTPTKAQEKAFNRVVKAILSAKKKGIIFMGQQNILVGFRKEVFEDNIATNYKSIDYKNPIPTLFELCCLFDSGADDMYYFKKGVIKET